MTLEQIREEKNSGKAGTFRSVVTIKTCKTRKTCNERVEKISELSSVRFGVGYDNMQDVQEKRANGILPKENQGLPYGSWIEGLYPYALIHKQQIYVRVSLSKNTKTTITWLLNGKRVEYAEVEPFLLASEKPKKNGEKPNVINLKIENIVKF